MSNDIELRDYFAAQALNGFMATIQTPFSGHAEPSYNDHLAEGAYLIADAMLKAREAQDERT